MTDKEMVSKEKFKKFSRNLNEDIFSVAVPFLEMKGQVYSLKKESLQSFKIATDAFITALEEMGNKTLKAKAFLAFSACYAEMELDDQASEMTKKCKQLCEEHNLEMPS